MKHLSLFLLFLTANHVAGQSDITKVFQISPTLYDLGTQILPTNNGYAVFGYQVATGSSSSTNGDIYLLRLDQEGNEIGRHFYGLPNKTEGIGKGVVAVGNDGWMLAGWQVANSSGNPDPYLVRVAANGNVIWSKTLPHNFYGGVAFTDLAALPGGDFIAVGKNNFATSVMRIGGNGEVVWYKSYSGGPAKAVYVSESGGNCFVVGRDKVLKIRTSNGQLTWMNDIELPVFGDPTGFIDVTLNDIVSMGNGQFSITGTAINDVIFSYSEAPYASLWKENGEIVWANAYPDAPGTGNALLYLPNQQELLLSGEGSDGISVTRLDKTGRQLDISSIPTPGLCIYPVLAKHEGKYMATGGNFYAGMNTLFYRSGGNWLPDGNLRPADRNAFSTVVSFSVLPNPAMDYLQVNFESEMEGDSQFLILRADGKVVLEMRRHICLGGNSIRFDVSALAGGIYWVVVPGVGFRRGWVKG